MKNLDECGWMAGWMDGWMGWDGMGWDGIGWDGMGWDGMGWDGLGSDGIGWDEVGWAGMPLDLEGQCLLYGFCCYGLSHQAPQFSKNETRFPFLAETGFKSSDSVRYCRQN